ncbi:MAG: DUF2924 domain-containing protein [Marinomonas sp.]|uniref:DUF2924 domain-containing protein n=1 Tax=Parasphingorhabdus sp. TaxID=2709688 RepID=UPI00328CEDF8
MMGQLQSQLNELEQLQKDKLCDQWVKLTGHPLPLISVNLLRLALAYEIQAQELGGLSRKTRQRLAQHKASISITSDVRPGMRLAREFGGKVHVVTIGDEGQILWNNREWRSLSEVAHAITGTRWSGPAFFGLRKRKEAA